MSDQLLANLCAGWMCCGSPLAFFWLGLLVGRHGMLGLVRNVRARFV